MIINGSVLLIANPMSPMVGEKIREHGVSYGLSEAGYDIRIAQTVEFHPTATRVSKPFVWVDGKWHEGKFCLASTVELFHMPRSMVGIVHDKSTWARKGLSVFNTVIEPGWRGILTLELVYHGTEPLTIPAGAGIAQVVFHGVMEPAQYDGKYQDQKEGPQGAIMEGGDV